MSGEYNVQHLLTLVAITDVPAYHIAQSSGDGTSQTNGGLATADTQILVGVNQAAVVAGDQMGVAFFGISKVRAGASITKGARITTNASGRAVAATSGDVIIGYAKDGAADGDLFTAVIGAFNDKMLA